MSDSADRSQLLKKIKRYDLQWAAFVCGLLTLEDFIYCTASDKNILFFESANREDDCVRHCMW